MQPIRPLHFPSQPGEAYKCDLGKQGYRALVNYLSVSVKKESSSDELEGIFRLFNDKMRAYEVELSALGGVGGEFNACYRSLVDVESDILLLKTHIVALEELGIVNSDEKKVLDGLYNQLVEESVSQRSFDEAAKNAISEGDSKALEELASLDGEAMRSFLERKGDDGMAPYQSAFINREEPLQHFLLTNHRDLYEKGRDQLGGRQEEIEGIHRQIDELRAIAAERGPIALFEEAEKIDAVESAIERLPKGWQEKVHHTLEKGLLENVGGSGEEAHLVTLYVKVEEVRREVRAGKSDIDLSSKISTTLSELPLAVQKNVLTQCNKRIAKEILLHAQNNIDRGALRLLPAETVVLKKIGVIDDAPHLEKEQQARDVGEAEMDKFFNHAIEEEELLQKSPQELREIIASRYQKVRLEAHGLDEGLVDDIVDFSRIVEEECRVAADKFNSALRIKMEGTLAPRFNPLHLRGERTLPPQQRMRLEEGMSYVSRLLAADSAEACLAKLPQVSGEGGRESFKGALEKAKLSLKAMSDDRYIASEVDESIFPLFEKRLLFQKLLLKNNYLVAESIQGLLDPSEALNGGVCAAKCLRVAVAEERSPFSTPRELHADRILPQDRFDQAQYRQKKVAERTEYDRKEGSLLREIEEEKKLLRQQSMMIKGLSPLLEREDSFIAESGEIDLRQSIDQPIEREVLRSAVDELKRGYERSHREVENVTAKLESHLYGDANNQLTIATRYAADYSLALLDEEVKKGELTASVKRLFDEKRVTNRSKNLFIDLVLGNQGHRIAVRCDRERSIFRIHDPNIGVIEVRKERELFNLLPKLTEAYYPNLTSASLLQLQSKKEGKANISTTPLQAPAQMRKKGQEKRVVIEFDEDDESDTELTDSIEFDEEEPSTGNLSPLRRPLDGGG